MTLNLVQKVCGVEGKEVGDLSKCKEAHPEVVYDISNCKKWRIQKVFRSVVLEFGLSSNKVTWLTFKAKDAGQRHIWVSALSHAVAKKSFLYERQFVSFEF